MSTSQSKNAGFFAELQDRGSGAMSTGFLEDYDETKYGPLLGVSDEGSAAQVIADAAYKSAKARVLDSPGPMNVGVIIDGERMTSAGEVPIGPDEYREVTRAAVGRTFCTTNVGVRLNTRLYQPLPEFRVADSIGREDDWIDGVCGIFAPFIDTPDGHPRPLTVRFLLKSGESRKPLADLVRKVETARDQGRLAARNLHRVSFLLDFDEEILSNEQVEEIKDLLLVAQKLSVPEVAVDGYLVAAARPRLSVQGLLNILKPDHVNDVLAAARKLGVAAAYRYKIDPESAARTVWTGLHTARSQGLNGAKYGLVPLTLEAQQEVMREVQHWTSGWTAIPAFYVDTPLYDEHEVYLSERCEQAARRFLKSAADAGAKVVLVDCPDRITPRIDDPSRVTPRRLIRTDGGPDDRGVLTLNQIARLIDYAKSLTIKILWSGGIRPENAFQLGELGVFGIFTTSSTAQRIPVGPVLASDWQLPHESEPTELGVRRVHALLQAGFLSAFLNEDVPQLSQQLRERSGILQDPDLNEGAIEESLSTLDLRLQSGWKEHWDL